MNSETMRKNHYKIQRNDTFNANSKHEQKMLQNPCGEVLCAWDYTARQCKYSTYSILKIMCVRRTISFGILWTYHFIQLLKRKMFRICWHQWWSYYTNTKHIMLVLVSILGIVNKHGFCVRVCSFNVIYLQWGCLRYVLLFIDNETDTWTHINDLSYMANTRRVKKNI